MADVSAVKSRKFYLEIFLISFAALLLETSYTRVFSFKIFYFFTYLIIGIALLGFGTGGVVITVFPRLRSVPLNKLIPICCLVGGISTAVGYFVIALINLDSMSLTSSISQMLRFFILCMFLFASFLSVGTMISAMFGRAPASISRLYFADLAGASLGCALVVPLMATISPPACIFLSAFVLTAAGLRLSASSSRPLFGYLLLTSLLIVLPLVVPSARPEIRVDAQKTLHPSRSGRENVIFSKWSPVFRVDALGRRERPAITLAHDGLIGSAIHRFDGDISSLARFSDDVRGVPMAMAPPEAEVLIIGAAGGHEILTSLYFGAKHITGVELNPVTASLLRTEFADYTGHIVDHERVTYVQAEGRSFLKRQTKKYDLIYFVAPDSYSAMNAATSGAFVLSESYLYTTEMIQNCLEHLTERGLIAMQFGEVAYESKPNRTTRYVLTAREAFERAGIQDFSRHILIGTSKGIFQSSMILLRREAFEAEEISRFLDLFSRVNQGRARHVWNEKLDGGAVNQAIAVPADELESWLSSYPYAVHAVTDDSPFFWHFARFRDVLRGGGPALGSSLDLEDSLGERMLLFVLIFAAVFGGTILLLPSFAIRSVWRGLPRKLHVVLYFGCLGLGFMFYEVYLIQRLTLFLGYPTYSLTVTLMAILVSTGLGSLASGRFESDPRRVTGVLLIALLFLTAFYLFGIGPLIDGLIGLPLGVRIAISIAFIVPLGFCLGAFMPLGLAAVSRLTEHKEEIISWSWAVNGFFSVISSVLATMLSMTWGFSVVLVLAFLIYGVAILTLRSLRAVSVPAP